MKIIYYLLFLALFSNCVVATGIMGMPMLQPRVDFVPGATYNAVYIAALEDIPNDYNITINPPYDKYSVSNVTYIPNGTGHVHFVVAISMPDDLEPGIHAINICIRQEKCASGGSACGRTGVCAGPRIRSLFPGIYPKFAYTVANVNINETTNIALGIENWGVDNINLLS